MLTVNAVTKDFGKIRALNEITFSVKSGEIAALLGPNGAGKTTLMRLMAGLLTPNSGSIIIDSFDINSERIEALSQIGYVSENAPLYNNMNVYEFLAFTAGLRGIKKNVFAERLEQLICKLELGTVINRQTGELSKGFRRRTAIAAAVLANPAILIMDEPAEGLDPGQKFALQGFLKDFAQTGTVILSTHIMEEVEALAGRVLVLNAGKLIKDTTPIRLKYLMPEQNISASFRRIIAEDKDAENEHKSLY